MDNIRRAIRFIKNRKYFEAIQTIVHPSTNIPKPSTLALPTNIIIIHLRQNNMRKLIFPKGHPFMVLAWLLKRKRNWHPSSKREVQINGPS
jgi:hypothetical protein